MLPLCTPTKGSFTRDESVPLLVQKHWDLSSGAMQGVHQSRAKAKSLQGQAGSPAVSLEATVQQHGATLDPKVHIRTASEPTSFFWTWLFVKTIGYSACMDFKGRTPNVIWPRQLRPFIASIFLRYCCQGLKCLHAP